MVWALIPSLLSPSRIYKIAEILFRPSANKSAVELPAEELLSIVVDPSQQGEGYAEKLFVSLCKYFDAKGVPEFRIVVEDLFGNLAQGECFRHAMPMNPGLPLVLVALSAPLPVGATSSRAAMSSPQARNSSASRT